MIEVYFPCQHSHILFYSHSSNLSVILFVMTAICLAPAGILLPGLLTGFLWMICTDLLCMFSIFSNQNLFLSISPIAKTEESFFTLSAASYISGHVLVFSFLNTLQRPFASSPAHSLLRRR